MEAPHRRHVLRPPADLVLAARAGAGVRRPQPYHRAARLPPLPRADRCGSGLGGAHGPPAGQAGGTHRGAQAVGTRRGAQAVGSRRGAAGAPTRDKPCMHIVHTWATDLP
ncbi:hypothetical protein MTBUT4_100075 [Magnetospirillum sp. UT-4]|nr:hypothetical protein MTBUT4_100075 [Magnetospirillum sp. UT-4]